MKEVLRTEILKLMEVGIIYPIADSIWVSPIHCVPKKGGITVVPNDKNELIPQRIVTGYRMVIDFPKLNKATRKDHYPLPFIDQMLERLSKHTHFCFLDCYSGFSQIPMSKQDQEKTTLIALSVPLLIDVCLLVYAMQLLPFKDVWVLYSLTFVKDRWGFPGWFSVYWTSFDDCLSNLDRVLQRCEETNLVSNWEKCHFMVNEGIVLGHKIS